MKDRILYLTRADMDSVGPGVAQIVDLLHEGFVLKGGGKVVLPPKHWLERSNDRFYSAMSSYIPELGFSGCKWQSGDPINSARGYPYIQGIYVLTEDTYGVPVALMDSEWITGRRTASASALAVKYLANPDASTLAILGCGLQGRSHLEVIKSVLPKLSKVKVFDIRRDVAETFARELSVRHEVEIAVANDPNEAVLGSEVVISGGPILTPPKPVIEANWLMEGVTGVTIDYDSYWTEDAMRAMDLIITDDRGQIAHLNEYGLFLGLRKLDGELGDLAVGRLQGRKSRNDKILCFNLGIAIEDLVTAVSVYRSALDKNVGTMLSR